MCWGLGQRREGYLEGGGWLVSWCVGHLAELADAAAYDPAYAKWRKEDLPILPERWRFTISPDKRDQFDTLRTLLRREDVTEVVNACDAGREGELIFRTVYALAGCSKPISRLWISSMEDEAIREGFAHLRPGREYDGLHQAALCRSKADWLVGINATRLFSLLYGCTLNIGRVVSPTLALVVQREVEIAAFQPETFYTVELDCGGLTLAGERKPSKKEAQEAAARCQGSTATVQAVERREKTEKPPALFDLTTLQREANRTLGYTAQQTLDYLQALYDKKFSTYPRTDSRYLTDDMEAGVPALVEAAASIRGVAAPETVLAGQVCDSARVERPPCRGAHGQRGQGGTWRPCPLGSVRYCGWCLWACSGPSARLAALRRPASRRCVLGTLTPPNGRKSCPPAGRCTRRRRTRRWGQGRTD